MLSRASLFALVASLSLAAVPSPAEEFQPRTRVSISGGFWEINGVSTFAGTDADGLLMNARMVNATFEDRNPKTCPADFDPDANTAAFLNALPEYVQHGVLAFTLNLQGGDPGYEGALNSAFEADGSLRGEYLARVARVIEACDRLGAVVILGCFYQRQDQVLADEAAVRKAVVGAASWVRDRGYTNVILEIANEYEHSGFDHAVIRTDAGVASLIRLAREAAPKLLISTSGLGDGRMTHEVGNSAHFYLLHFNGVPADDINSLVVKASKSSKAVVCNEDDKTGALAVKSMRASIDALCSWGYMNKVKNQHYPFVFEGAQDDPIFYAALAQATGKKD